MPRARHAVTEYAERCGADPFNVGLATTEAVTNAVVHAYREERSGPIRVKAGLDGSDLLVVVEDEGVGMQPNIESAGLGMGMSLMGAMSSEMNIESAGRGVAITMRFPCPRGEDPTPPPARSKT